MVSRKRANHHKQTATKNQQGRRHANPAKQKTGPEPKPNTHNNHTRFAKWHRESVPPCHHKTCTTNHWKSSSMAQLPCEYFFCPSRRVYGLESYSRTSHHRQSVSDTRVPRHQLRLISLQVWSERGHCLRCSENILGRTTSWSPKS